MKESTLRKKAIDILQKADWVTWRPPRVKFFETDVFGIFDILAWKLDELRGIQITTLPNKSARIKKIQNFLIKNNLGKALTMEVWAYDIKKKQYRFFVL